MFQFKSLQDVILRFSDEKVCEAYLEQIRWNGKPVCPHCKCEKVYRIKSPKQPYKCGDKDCLRKFSVRVGLIFEGSNIPLSKWFLGMYLSTAHKKGISSVQLAKDLGITQKSGWFMGHRLREMARNKSFAKMRGIIEIDEVYMGGKTANKHKKQRDEINKKGTGYINKTGVIGILQRDTEVRMEVIGQRNQGTHLKPIIRRNVSEKSYLVTDGLGAYKDLGNEFSGHEVVNHAQDEFVRGFYHTNSIEGFFSQLRRSIYGIYHWCSPKHLQRYCDESAYRYNTIEMTDGDRFNASLKRSAGRLKYYDLVNKVVI